MVYECNRPMRGQNFWASTSHRPSCIHTPQTPVLFLYNISYLYYIPKNVAVYFLDGQAEAGEMKIDAN